MVKTPGLSKQTHNTTQEIPMKKEFIPAVSITVVLKDGTLHAGQSTNGIRRSEMEKCFYTLADGTTVDAMVREDRGKKS
jgi:hypothetical protein